MIFVTVGTARAFDRLVAAADVLAADEEVVVQHGSGRPPAIAMAVPFLAYDGVAELMRSARVVVAHAGAGSALTALLNGRRPVVVPRLRAYDEAVDDHQVEFAGRLARSELVHVVHDVVQLPRVVSSLADAATHARVWGSPLARRLRDEIADTLADARAL